MKLCLRNLLLLFVVCVSRLSLAGEHEFNGVVAAIESHYGVHRVHIPLLGFAMLFAHPAGASGIKLAVFQDFPRSSASARDDMQHIVERSLSQDWQLFIRTRSQENSDNTLIYVNLSDGKMQMLIVNAEPDGATIVEMKLNESAIKKWITGPRERAEDQSWHRHLADN